MPFRLIPPSADRRTPYYTIRGSHLGCPRIHRSTKTSDERLARQILRALERSVERGELAEPSAPTFASAAASYMKADGDRKYLAPLIRHFQTTLLSRIDQAAIDDAAATLYPGRTAATRNRQVYTPVSAVMKHAGIERAIKRPKGWRGRKLTHWLTPEQAFAVFAATSRIDAPKDTRTEFRIYLRMLCYTGMRLSEPLRLTCADVDLKRCTALLHHTKGGMPRLVYLPPVLIDELGCLPRGLDRNARLFRFHAGGRMRDLLKMTLELAGVVLPRRVGFHVFSHTWATWMRQHGGLDTYDLLKTDRWSDPESADRYAHVVASEQAKKADLLPVERKRARR